MMITNRNVAGSQLGNKRNKVRFYISDKTNLRSLDDWTELEREQFRKKLIEIAGQFPLIGESENEKQKHVSFFIHGYNNSWTDAVQRYRKIQKELYADQSGLGQLILFTWPSNGSTYRITARCAYVRVELSGPLISEGDVAPALTGPGRIAFQYHTGKVQFRSIRLKHL